MTNSPEIPGTFYKMFERLGLGLPQLGKETEPVADYYRVNVTAANVSFTPTLQLWLPTNFFILFRLRDGMLMMFREHAIEVDWQPVGTQEDFEKAWPAWRERYSRTMVAQALGYAA